MTSPWFISCFTAAISLFTNPLTDWLPEQREDGFTALPETQEILKSLLFFFFPEKSPNACCHSPPVKWENIFHTFHGFARTNCAVSEKRGGFSQGKTEDEKKNAEYLRNQNQGLLNNFSTASRRLLFAKYRRSSRWCKGLLSHCHPICSLYSTISLNHISTPNISWTATELHAFLCKDTLKSYCSQSSFYLSSFEETSRGIIVSHNAGTQLVHHPSGFNQALQKGNTE